MTGGFITDDEVDAALAWLRDNATTAAKNRAQRLFLEDFSKHLHAKLMKEFGGSVAAQERDAYADPRYLQHIEAVELARYEDERTRYLVAAAQAKLDAWRTQSATERAMKL